MLEGETALPIRSAVDIGTNSVRLLVAEVGGGKVRRLCAVLRSTRLGEGMYPRGRLQPQPLRRTAAALEEMRELLAARGWPVPRVVATSAAREAENAAELAEIVEALGWRLEVLPGEQEAVLSYRGATAGLGVTDPVVVDIGGGSTEIAWMEGGRLRSFSLPLGAVRCTAAGILPPEMRRVLAPVLAETPLRGGRPLVGVGGSITSLAAIVQGLREYNPDRVHGFVLTRDAVRRTYAYLRELPLAERQRVPGLQPARADIIPAGAAILLAVLDEAAAPGITVSEADLLYALVIDKQCGQGPD